MEDALKARLIGATVLVALAVLLIPELLSGRKQESPAAVPEVATARGTRTFTIELAGGPQGSTASETPPAVRNAPLPVPTATETAAQPAPVTASQSGPAEPAATVAEEAQPVRVAQAASPQPSPPSAPAAKSAVPEPAPETAPSIPGRGGWAVQVGAFGSAASAAKLVNQLHEAGYKAYVSPVSRGGKTLHRVRVGPEAERSEAESLVAGLKVRGLPATVVAND
jgi:DedD protein